MGPIQKPKRKKLKADELKRSAKRTYGQIPTGISLSLDEIKRVNLRCQMLNVNRSAYFRELIRKDLLANGPLIIHAVRHDFLKEMQEAMEALQKEREQLAAVLSQQPQQPQLSEPARTSNPESVASE